MFLVEEHVIRYLLSTCKTSRYQRSNSTAQCDFKLVARIFCRAEDSSGFEFVIFGDEDG